MIEVYFKIPEFVSHVLIFCAGAYCVNTALDIYKSYLNHKMDKLKWK